MKPGAAQEAGERLARLSIRCVLAYASHYSGEREPVPVAGLVGIQRPIHALAARVLNLADEPSRSRSRAFPGSIDHREKHWWLVRYLNAVDEFYKRVLAAHLAGKLTLREPQTGFRASVNMAPNFDWVSEWFEAAYLGEVQRASDLMQFPGGIGSAGDFIPFVAVREDDFDAWAVQECATRPGEVIELVRAQDGLASKVLELEGQARSDDLSYETLAKAAANLFSLSPVVSQGEIAATNEVLTDNQLTIESAEFDCSPMPLTTPEMAKVFTGVDGTNSKVWRRKLGDPNNHRWLLPARVAQVKAPNPSTWNPMLFANLLQKKRGVPSDVLNRLFVNSPKLKPWLRMWQEAGRWPK